MRNNRSSSARIKRMKFHGSGGMPSPSSTPSEHRELADYLRKVRFKRRLFGGVDEMDVWKKIEELNRLYEEALKAERIRYDTLLEEQRTSNLPTAGEMTGDS